MESKTSIRKSMKKKLSVMDEMDYLRLSNLIAENLFQLDEWDCARTVGITISNGREVDTSPIIKKAWAEGKKIVVPKCIPSSKGMIFREIQSYDDLEVVYFGLKEPIESVTEEVTKDEIDLMIVPGLAFTKEGYRVGFGGGYYDRYLKGFSNPTFSLAFEMQVVGSVPFDSFDVPVKRIITNERIIDCDE